MKPEGVLKILETLGDMAMNMTDLWLVILSSGYGASYRNLQFGLTKHRKNRDRRSLENLFEKKFKQRYYDLLYRLKRDGLIEEEARGDKKLLSLTKKGRNKLLLLRNWLREPLPPSAYQGEENNKFTIIAFDIPEKEKRKRNWLRAALKSLGLQMVQKSVWIGKVKIPKGFLDDLSKLKLLDFIEIFEISKAGSLKHIT